MDMRIRRANLADAAAIARIQVDTWRTTYPGIVPAEYLANLSYRDGGSWWETVLSKDRPAARILVAQNHVGEVIGFAGGGRERQGNPTYMAELYFIMCSLRINAGAWDGVLSRPWRSGSWRTGSVRCWCGC